MPSPDPPTHWQQPASGTSSGQNEASYLRTLSPPSESSSGNATRRSSLALNYLPTKFTRPVSVHDEGSGSGVAFPVGEGTERTDVAATIVDAPEVGVQRRKTLLSRLYGSKSPGSNSDHGGVSKRLRARMPKRGGGREAFREHEARMPDEGDEDYDGVEVSKDGRRQWWKIWMAGMHWNRFKWTLLGTNFIVSTLCLSSSQLC